MQHIQGLAVALLSYAQSRGGDDSHLCQRGCQLLVCAERALLSCGLCRCRIPHLVVGVCLLDGEGGPLSICSMTCKSQKSSTRP